VICQQVRATYRRKLLFSLFLFLVLAAPHIEAASFQDAADRDEAAGMMENRIIDVGILQVQCSSRYPEIKTAIQEQAADWQKTDAVEIHKANYYWSVMTAQHPDDARQINEAMVMGINKIIDEKSHQDSDGRMLKLFCEDYFAHLSAWRQRTPKMYQFLLQIPDGQSR
jgi:hypothetical protein